MIRGQAIFSDISFILEPGQSAALATAAAASAPAFAPLQIKLFWEAIVVMGIRGKGEKGTHHGLRGNSRFFFHE